MNNPIIAEEYVELNHTFLNTGGGHLTSIFTFFSNIESRVVYVICDSEGYNISPVDYITNDLPFDGHVLSIEASSWDDLELPELFTQKYLLCKHCQFEFYRKYCRAVNQPVEVPVSWLPAELLGAMDAYSLEWHKKEEENVTTDGYKVWPSINYREPTGNVVLTIDGTKYTTSQLIDTNTGVLEDITVIYRLNDSDEIDGLIDWYYGDPDIHNTEYYVTNYLNNN